jgi:hypothetical protein
MPNQNNQIGYSHWLKIRNEFTKNHKKYNPNQIPSLEEYPELNQVTSEHMETVYKGLISGRRFLSKAPLSFIIKVLIYGWKKENLVPVDWPPTRPETPPPETSPMM